MSSKGRALLIEDNAIIALDAQDMLVAIGFDPVDIAASVAAALALTGQHKYAAAIIDLIVRDGPTIAAAERLARAGVPIVITTGYSEGADAPFPTNAPRVMKPYDEAMLRAALAAACAAVDGSR